MTCLYKKNTPQLNLAMSFLGPATLETVVVRATENTSFLFFFFFVIVEILVK